MEEIKKQIETVEEHTEDVYQLAIKTLDRNYKRERFMIKCLLAIIVALIAVLFYFGYVFKTTKGTYNSNNTVQGGSYNIVDEDGHIISSNLSSEDISRINEILNGSE